MLKAEETRGGPLSVKQLNTVLVFIAIRYSDYCYYIVIIRNTFL